MTIYPNLIIEALKNVRYPGTGKDIVSMGLVEDNIRIDGMNVTFSLLFEKPNDPFIRSVVKAAETAILTYVSPEVNIKGARMWTGAKESLETGMKNVAFLRTSIELISYFFAPGEVAEIWITFPDPQMKKVNKRLTGTRFMKMYLSLIHIS